MASNEVPTADPQTADTPTADPGTADTPGSAEPGGDTGDTGFYQGGTVTPGSLTGPSPNGHDDGEAGLSVGEFVVRQPEAARYASILQQINNGTFPNQGASTMQQPTIGPTATGYMPNETRSMADPYDMIDGDAGETDGGGVDDDEGMMDDNDDQSPLMPSNGADALSPDDVMMRLSTLPPPVRQQLSVALSDPTTGGALLALLGPAFAPVVAAATGGSPMAAAPGGPPMGGMPAGMAPPGNPPPPVMPGGPAMMPPGPPSGLGGLNA